ncbi:MAG: FAD-dependent oxidoreductase [Beijerinckiaceae bacterium]
MQKDQSVLIAGGGPVGLFCAMLLGRSGVDVTLFEAGAQFTDDPRAATTHPATLEVLGKAGLVEDMKAAGLVAPIFQFWDRPSKELVAEFDHALLAGETPYPFVIQCEQFKTSRIILDRIAAMPNVRVLMDHALVSLEQDASCVTAQVKTPGGSKTFRGDYLIGADGGRSTVRKQAGIPFEGFTWPERFLVLTTPFDFEKERGYCYRSYFADPDEWCNCFKVAADGPPGLWRTVFPTDPNLSEEDVMGDAVVQARLQRFFPKSTPYEIVHRNLYTTHQRVAATFRKGRILLAGDSAHVNNSIGGMGLNGGLQDAANLSEKLAQVLMDNAPDTLLDLYSLQRRTVSIEFVQEQSIANKKRLEAKDPAERARNFDNLRKTAADPERARDFLRRSAMLTMQRRADSITFDEAAA